MRRYDDPVEVRKGANEDPEQFLWKDRLWQVREVVAHWVETGSWWSGSAAARDLLHEREVWRVTAARGREQGFGVFDLVFSWTDGSWQLARAVD